MRKHRTEPWRFKTPSETCETMLSPRYNVVCGLTAAWAYPAQGGGYHAMCPQHAQKHLSICVTIDEAKRGKLPNLPVPGGADADA